MQTVHVKQYKKEYHHVHKTENTKKTKHIQRGSTKFIQIKIKQNKNTQKKKKEFHISITKQE